MRGFMQLMTKIIKINKTHKLCNLRNLSYPAIQMPEEFPEDNNITFILDHGYVCPICKDKGYIKCNYCTQGCVFCPFKGFKKCKCQISFNE